MYRPKHLLRFLLAPTLVMLAVMVGGCTGSEEQPTIQKFFQASRLRDNITVANISTVSFDPRTDGQVEGFSITSVSPETTQLVHLKELTRAHKDAVAADTEFTKQKKQYQDANTEAIERILKAEAAGKKIAGKDAAVQAAWNKWREETQQHAKAVSEAREKMNAERPIVEVSVPNLDVSDLDGQLLSKDVTLDARIRTPDGKTSNKTLVVTMQQAKMKKADGSVIEGRWIITRLKEAGAAGAKTS